ncbi:double-strand break repair protein AddB [Roseovarius spongiae]|uniref:Double-strand break repair protein AddB n=1 Tax=Roseovarius spongiae TaxID=2320272 RepID=A0A3A8AU39_9RHOB|nr:double-strand break repair protein AddB [Roseovarius spongiae]RKF13391.1 double-strand break repair protein AddB [Roseovarius spongiae]
MFEPQEIPRVCALPPGVDFPAELIAGLDARLAGEPPEALARVQLIVNTRRMARRIRALWDAGPPRLLPRIALVTDLGLHTGLPAPAPALRRRLELIQLIARLIEQQPDLAPRSALYDLADSLAALMDEMQTEGVSPDAIDALDVSDQSGHWDRIRAFLNIVRRFTQAPDLPDAGAWQRQAVEATIAAWQAAPPAHPVILAGSTGSRGATQMLMQAVARLPQGAVVLPGYDFDMPDAVWGGMADPLLSEDHPQYRYHALRRALDLGPRDIARWTGAAPANPARNRVVSLALRPAPMTDAWREEGPALNDLDAAMADVTLLEAPSQRQEALTIAMRLRQAAEDGQTAALITPDRGLTRQVAAAFDRWRIVPDDSAGVPLHLTPPGRLLRHVADLPCRRLTAETLLTILKHPMTHSGGERGAHLLLTRELELHLRRNGPPYPTAEDVIGWAAEQTHEMAADWGAWLAAHLCGQEDGGAERPLTARVAAHLATAGAIAGGCRAEPPGALWSREDGRAAREAMEELHAEAGHGGDMRAADYAALVHAILSRGEVRNPDEPHPDILIWGTLEARVQGAELLILAGLNEGSWPEAASPDPWLNRELRHRAGLLLPERRIGLAAHDFQQAIAARKVWLTRSVRSEESETVVSRWVNRLQNLLAGLPDQGGAAALDAMRARGRAWLDLAARLEEAPLIPPAPRPSPCPPVAHRPDRLSVTEIKRLIRDPYSIYAKHVLRLRPLDPLMKLPDYLLRGIVLHKVLEVFVSETAQDAALCTTERLLATADRVLAEHVPWREARVMWRARLGRIAERFVTTELTRRAIAQPTGFEKRGEARIDALGFTLVAYADRIDIAPTGKLHIFDYKSGEPPTPKEQQYFDKQLLLEAAMAQIAGFDGIPAAPVAQAAYIGLGGSGKVVPAPLDETPPGEVWAQLAALIAAYAQEDMGYTARRAMQKKEDTGDYDQLARFGEWDATAPPDKRKVGR